MINYENKFWLKQLFAWRGTVIKSILIRVILFMLWTAIITYMYWEGFIPSDSKIDMVVFNVIGLALGLLLVFRTNSSYDRYWEGRKLLGSTVNACRNLAQLLNTLIPKDDRQSRAEFAKLITAFNFAVKERLRDGVKAEHLTMLSKDYLDDMLNHDHVPNAIMKTIFEKIDEKATKYNASESLKIAMSTETGNLINNMGGMERIRFTPVPFAYASHLQLFIAVYFISLPFGLYQQLHWFSIPAIAFIALVLLGINEIGVEIEDPFGTDPNDLPVDNICENIAKNVNEILER